MPESIAIVGMSCRYPGADSPEQLWENVLARRRAFRRLPTERLRLEDYYSQDRSAPDRTYSTMAAVLSDYTFDRLKYSVSAGTFRSTDMAHWLALDVACEAMADAGFQEASMPDRRGMGVIVGNTLTGEFSRAQLMRLRWPYVRRVVAAAMGDLALDDLAKVDLLTRVEQDYKSSFTEQNEDTLAGGLSNTIAGRICSHLRLQGGGYTVDGACASSLLAVATACNALSAGDLDVAIVGGVDLSLDPFELVGFAKNGALAETDMLVYDEASSGFWPGEGCGFAVLMRDSDAAAYSTRRYAVIRGWGISSDGTGSITRPDVQGQRLAIERAYRRAGVDPTTVGYFEGHGTGTKLGDRVELEALGQSLHDLDPSGVDAPARECPNGDGRDAHPTIGRVNSDLPAIGSMKSLIGHTKAAAGMAGLIKSTMAVYRQVLPPHIGTAHPNTLLVGDAQLRTLSTPRPWPAGRPARAAVSAMGFGGINTHVVLDAAAESRRQNLDSTERRLARSYQDAELLLFDAPTREALFSHIEHVAGFAGKLSFAELGDLSAALADRLSGGRFRAAVVARTPEAAASGLSNLIRRSRGSDTIVDQAHGLFLGDTTKQVRIGYLFPGQGSPVHWDGGIWAERFDLVDEIYAGHERPAVADTYSLPLPKGKGAAPVDTRWMQPVIARSSAAAVALFEALGVEAAVGIGHSLGELAALHWSGAFDLPCVLDLAAVRGRVMAESGGGGGMASIMATAERVEALIVQVGAPVPFKVGAGVVSLAPEDSPSQSIGIAGYNGPRQTVVSGSSDQIDRIVTLAADQGLTAVRLPVSQAFHSPLVAGAAQPLREYLASQSIRPMRKRVASTVTGTVIPNELINSDGIINLLCRQVTEPVRFIQAVETVSSDVDLWIEMGSGSVLTGLIGALVQTPVIATDAGGSSLHGLLMAAGAAFAGGVPLNTDILFKDRFTRPISLDWSPTFFTNPCESFNAGRDAHATSILGQPPGSVAMASEDMAAAGVPAYPVNDGSRVAGSTLDVLKRLTSEHLGLPIEVVAGDRRMLSDLHLSSITVGQIVAMACRELGLTAPESPLEHANSTISEIADVLQSRSAVPLSKPAPREPAGMPYWARAFQIVHRERPLIFSDRSRSFTARPAADESTTVAAWQRFEAAGFAHGAALGDALKSVPVNGILVGLPDEAGPTTGSSLMGEEAEVEAISLLVMAGHAALSSKLVTHFVVVQTSPFAAGFVKCLAMEAPHLTICVIEIPPGTQRAVDWIVAEIKAASGAMPVAPDEHAGPVGAFVETRYDAEGNRSVPIWESMALIPDGPNLSFPFTPSDVVLITGGGKGIGAECAFHIGRDSGARLAIVGRASPTSDKDLAGNLARMRGVGIDARYYQADVCDAGAVASMMARVREELGPITACIHAAGVNHPQSISHLTAEDCLRTSAPKVDGLKNLLTAFGGSVPRIMVTFGSIIARIGLHGEADYALANEWQTNLLTRYAGAHPDCRCLAMEWSAWSGSGMGERLAGLDGLGRLGVTPITPESGVSLLKRALATEGLPLSIVVSSRFGRPRTALMSLPETDRSRFIERIVSYYPGAELVAEAVLSPESDPYLDDHVYQSNRLFPAVLGLEAMAQAARALSQSTAIPTFHGVTFARPIVVPESESLGVAGTRMREVSGGTKSENKRTAALPHSAAEPRTIRIIAHSEEDGVVSVAIRSNEDDFQTDCFTARYDPASECAVGVPDREAARQPLNIDPARHLYGTLLFQSGRFARLEGYTEITARRCAAQIRGAQDSMWSHYRTAAYDASDLSDLSDRAFVGAFLLGDCGARDAALHALQVCVPHRTVVPIGVERIDIARVRTGEPTRVRARETSSAEGVYTYDLSIEDEDGQLVERWKGLRLRAIGPERGPDGWPPILLAPYLERILEERLPGSSVSSAVVQDHSMERTARSDAAIQLAIGRALPVTRDANGKPSVAETGDMAVSASHTGDVTLAVAVKGRTVACDIEAVAVRPAVVWRDLLGAGRYALAEQISTKWAEDLHTSATRVWTVLECLKKAGLPIDTPIQQSDSPFPGGERGGGRGVISGSDQFCVLAAGDYQIATLCATLDGGVSPIIAAVLQKISPPYYEYRHVVGFEETNLVGNVYYANYISWQGRCREMFLRDHSPAILDELRHDLCLVTTQASCEYLQELSAFDQVSIRMSILDDGSAPDMVTMRFEYWRETGGTEEMVAHGQQQIASRRRVGRDAVKTPLPDVLRSALAEYRAVGMQRV